MVNRSPRDQGLTKEHPLGFTPRFTNDPMDTLFKANPTLLLLDRRFGWNLKFVFKFWSFGNEIKLFLCNSGPAGLSHGQGLGPWAMFVNAISTSLALALKGQVRTERFWVSPTRMPFANLAKTSPLAYRLVSTNAATCPWTRRTRHR